MNPCAETTKCSSLAATHMRFGLRELLEFVSLSAVILASSPLMGIVASGCLILLAFFLWARRGEFALAAMMAATIATEMEPAIAADGAADGVGYEVGRLLLVIGHVAAISTWYCLRRRLGSRESQRND